MVIKSIKQFSSMLIISSMLFSCGKSPEAEIKSNLISAEIHLSKYECQSAIDLLENMGRKNTNARYLKLLASAYACRSGYSTITFFGSDVSLTATPAPLGGISRYSTSTQTFTSPLVDDSKFVDLQTAIDILLYAGGISSTTEPTALARSTKFSSSEAADINAQLFYMTISQLGRIFKVYADADSAGVKGGGSASNVCFSDYPSINAQVELILTNQQGACKVKNSPHSQLNSALLSEAERRTRMCQGIVLLNNVLELLPNILASAGGGDLDDLSSVTSDISTAKTALVVAYPAIATTATVLSQENCETSADITMQTIESYYAAIIEALIE